MKVNWQKFNPENPPKFGEYWVAREGHARAEVAECVYDKPVRFFRTWYEGHIYDVTHFAPFERPELPREETYL